MTKQEAINAMQEGERITHYLFSSHEWMTMKHGYIVLEDGVVCPPSEFWKWRTASLWDDGYEVWSEQLTANPNRAISNFPDICRALGEDNSSAESTGFT